MVSSSTREQLAEQRVTVARRIVARQRRLIANLKACNGDRYPQEAELLAAFETSLAVFEDDLATITSAGARAPTSDALKTGAV